MKRRNFFSTRILRLFVLGTVMLLAGCLPKDADTLWQPETRTLPLYARYNIAIPDGYDYAGRLLVYAYAEGESPTVHIRDRFETFVFTREDGTVMLVQRNEKFRRVYGFRFLGGNKVLIDERPWRNASYILKTDTTDKEYRKYIAWLGENGVNVPEKYSVSIQDRLVSDFVLLRIMTLSAEPGGKSAPMPAMKSVKEYADSACGNMVLPSYRKLYQQERQHSSEHEIILP